METNEIVNNEVIEVAEELVPVTSGNGLKIAGGIGLAAIVGVAAYKGGKLIWAKIKAKKEEKDAVNVHPDEGENVIEGDFE